MALKSNQILVEAQLGYAHLLTPRSAPGSDKKNYGATFYIPKTKENKKMIDAALTAAAKLGVEKKQWGSEAPKSNNTVYDGDDNESRVARGRTPFNLADTAGFYVINSTNQRQFPVFRSDEMRTPITQEQEQDEVYSGAWVKVLLEFFPFNYNGTKGISSSPQAVQKVRDDERKAGSSVDMDLFGGTPDIMG